MQDWERGCCWVRGWYRIKVRSGRRGDGTIMSPVSEEEESLRPGESYPRKCELQIFPTSVRVRIVISLTSDSGVAGSVLLGGGKWPVNGRCTRTLWLRSEGERRQPTGWNPAGKAFTVGLAYTENREMKKWRGLLTQILEEVTLGVGWDNGQNKEKKNLSKFRLLWSP
jgi:hypothetical protein